jgi:hypothetical protein
MHSWLAEGPQKPQSAHLALVPPTNEKFTVRPSLSHRQRYFPRSVHAWRYSIKAV